MTSHPRRQPQCDPGRHEDGGAPGPDAATSPSRSAGHRPDQPAGWRVERIDTEPMTAAQHDRAVQALAALITTWRRTTTGAGDANTLDEAA